MSVSDHLQRVSVVLRGLPPGLIQQGKDLMAIKDSGGLKGPITRDQEAALHGHWVKVKGKKQLAIPWGALYLSICTAAGNFKMKGARGKSMTTLVAATISCDVDLISLGDAPVETYVDWVRIPPRTGSMVQIGRPRLREWVASFTMTVDTELYSSSWLADLREILEKAGKIVGVGAWRPQLKGPYGRFTVEQFEPA